MTGVYNPPPNRVAVDEAVWMIQASGFGHLVSNGPDGLAATGLPFLAARDAGRDGDQLTLRGHVARANPQWRTLDGADVMVIFPLADGYVSPSWYPSKADQPRVVPTWNYEVVHVHGRVVVHNDAEWTERLVRDLTDRHERGRVGEHRSGSCVVGRRCPADASSPSSSARSSGIEVVVGRIEGKRKLSQNRSDDDQTGVIAGLSGCARPVRTRPGRRDASRMADPDR